MHGAGAGVFGQGDGQHFDQDAVDVVFRLLFGQAQRIDLHAIAEAAILRLGHAIAGQAQLIPQIDKGAHLAQFGDKADAGIHEKADAAHHVREIFGRNLALQIVQHGAGGGQREGQFLFRRRPRFLQVIGTDVHRVPFGQMPLGIGGDIGDHPQRGFRRADIGPAREIFLDDVILHRAVQGSDIGALFFGHGDVKRQQPGGGGVDCHRGVHLLQRDIRKQHPHVAQVGHRHADLAHLAPAEFMITVIAGLGRQIEGHRQAGLPLGKIGPIERVRGFGGRMPGIGPEKPGLVFRGGGHDGLRNQGQQ